MANQSAATKSASKKRDSTKKGAPAVKRAPKGAAAEASDQQPPSPALFNLAPPAGAVRDKKRKGRGPGSGLGKTAGKGQKGQKARHPGDFGKLHFEGGQTPLQRRLPKIGFKRPFSSKVATVNLDTLNSLDAGTTVDPKYLADRRMVRGRFDSVKILGRGELTKKLNVSAHAVSEGARKKIEAAGGSVTILGEREPSAKEQSGAEQ